MASTEKVSLSLESGAAVLARRAAAIEGMSLSAYVSMLVKKHAWASQRPRLSVEEQAVADERVAELDEHELSDGGGQARATG